MNQRTMSMQNRVRTPIFLTLFASVVVVVMFFLPYINTVGSFRGTLEGFGDEFLFETDLTARDLKELSLFEYAKINYQASEEIYQNETTGKEEIIWYLLIPGFAILIGMLVLAKKPVLVLIFNALLGGLCYLMDSYFSSKGMLSGVRSKAGVAYYAFFICVAAIFICAIWIFIVKRKIKKETQALNVH